MLVVSVGDGRETVWITHKSSFFPRFVAVVFLICQHFKSDSIDDLPKERKEKRKTTREKSSQSPSEKLRRLHTFAPSRLGMAPFCSALIRFLPAEKAVIFLSLGFSCGRAALQTCHVHKALYPFLYWRKEGGAKKISQKKGVWRIFPAILVWKEQKTRGGSAEEDRSVTSAKCGPPAKKKTKKNFIPTLKNEAVFSLLHLIWLMLRQIFLLCAAAICYKGIRAEESPAEIKRHMGRA